MQSTDSVSVLRKLLRTYFEEDAASSGTYSSSSDDLKKVSGAPDVEEKEDPFALAAWIQRVYAQLVGKCNAVSGIGVLMPSILNYPVCPILLLFSSRVCSGSSKKANRDVQAAYMCCHGQPVTLGGKAEQAFDARLMQWSLPLLVVLALVHPFFMQTPHLMIAPSIEHFGEVSKWGRHTVRVTGSRGDSAGGGSDLSIEVIEDTGFNPATIVYPILGLIWLLTLWAVHRVHSISGVTRAVVASLGSVVHEETVGH